MKKTGYFIFTLLIILSFNAFAKNDISQIASSKNQWTGLAKSEDGRLFVNFPRWSDDVPISVGEIVDGKVVPYPDKEWNHYDKNSASINTFVCVQSVFMDKKNRLWVLDPVNPKFEGVVAHGPRLYQFDLNSNQHVKTYTFDRDTYFENSYLNDVRIDAEIPRKSKPRILMVITSHGVLGEEEGKPTGYFLSEVSHAYYVFKNAGYEVDFVSPQGGKSPVDGYDLNDEKNKRFVNDEEAQQKINNAMTPDEVNINDYRAVYYAGGHGTMWDLPENEGLASLTAKEYETGGVVGAVCHGPAGLVNVKLADSTYLVDGKTVSAFTNEEEMASGKDKYVPFMLESKLEERGAKHVKSENWQKKVAVDGRLVTGQNPASAKGVAEEMVRLLGESSK